MSLLFPLWLFQNPNSPSQQGESTNAAKNASGTIKTSEGQRNFYFDPGNYRNTYTGVPLPISINNFVPGYFLQTHSMQSLQNPQLDPMVQAQQETPPAKKASLADWMMALAQVGDAIRVLDVDLYNLPFSRNVVGNPKASSGLRRSSEYNPKKMSHPGLPATISPSIYGQAHGEIRPIQGQKDSLITRFTLDYRGAEVIYRPPGRNLLLEIDCFTAVTPPTIKYDRKFDKRGESITKIGRDGSTKYENACRYRSKGENDLATPFDSIAKPPPKTDEGSNPDWMLYFQPIRKDLLSIIAESYTNKKMGSLWLWANNPTLGFVDEDHYNKFGIRYNTWPRHFGNLIRFFTPIILDGENLRQRAPFLNPNSEYLDKDGKRQKIPDDVEELKKLNQERKKLGLEEVGRSRGPVVDWVGNDLFGDPKRMKATPADRYPKLSTHIQFKPGTVLDLPIGKVAIKPDTDLRISYVTSPVWVTNDDGQKEIRAKAEVKLSLGPLELGKTDLNLGPYHIKAGKFLHADQVEFTLPMLQVPDDTKKGWHFEPQWSAIEGKILGLAGKDLSVEDHVRGVTVNLEEVRLAKIDYTNDKNGTKALLSGLVAKGLVVSHNLGSLKLDQAEIPKIELSARHDLSKMKLKIPKITSNGNITLKPRFGKETEIILLGRSEISKFYFDRKVKDGKLVTSARFKINGNIHEATVENKSWGIATLSMEEGKKLHPISGSFMAHSEVSLEDKDAEPKKNYSMSLKIPYTGFSLSSKQADMLPGSSSLRDGIIRITPGALSFEGDLSLKAKEVRGIGTDVIRWQNLEVVPHLEDVEIAGSALLKWTKDGFLLRKRVDGKIPLHANFRLTDSYVTYTPFDEAHLKANPHHQVIKTNIKLADSQIVAENVYEVEYRTVEGPDGNPQGQLSRVESGPVMIHHVKGGGEIWAPTGIWEQMRGNFPFFGIPYDSIPDKPPQNLVDKLGKKEADKMWKQIKKPMSGKMKKSRPDPEKLIGHLSKEKRALLWDDALGDYSNFVHIGGISINSEEGKERSSHTEIRDLIFYVHETGNQWQFGALGIPELHLWQKFNNGKVEQAHHKVGDIFNHIYLYDPMRRYSPFQLGSKKQKGYQAPPPKEPQLRPREDDKIPFFFLGQSPASLIFPNYFLP